MDAEFAQVFAHIHDRGLKAAIQSLYMRSPDILCVRSKELQAYAASKGLAMVQLVGESFALYPKGTTRKRPACIVVEPGVQSTDYGGVYYEYLGVGNFQIVEKGNVHVVSCLAA